VLTTRPNRPTKRLIASLAALALVAGACDDDDDTAGVDTEAPEVTEAPDGTEPEPAVERSPTCTTALDEDDAVESLDELDFSGVTVNVGSKDFVEQFVLGQLAIVGLEAGGATVTDSTNLGGTVVNRDALLANEIDTYFEYNGTGWTVHLANEDPSFDAFDLTDDVCVNDLEQNDIRWVGVSPFNNTYGFATASAECEEGRTCPAGLDLRGMMEYVDNNADATVCMETEFPNRPDGLVLLEEAYGLTIPQDQVEILETGVIYDETASGNCTFGEVFTTDGRIQALDLEVIGDPGVFILYNASLTMPDSVYQQAPEAFEALADTIFQPLDNTTMAELNRRVSAEGEDPRDVAEDFLSDQGLL